LNLPASSSSLGAAIVANHGVQIGVQFDEIDEHLASAYNLVRYGYFQRSLQLTRRRRVGH
jgi:hypothetical protein